MLIESKYEIAAIKWDQIALCGIKCVNVKNILRIYFSYNRSLEHDHNYRWYDIKIEKKKGIVKNATANSCTSCFSEECTIQYNYLIRKNSKTIYFEEWKSWIETSYYLQRVWIRRIKKFGYF